MAAVNPVKHLWDPDYDETSQEAISDNTTYWDAIVGNLSMMTKELKLSDMFWDLLLEKGVLDKKAMDSIRV